MVWRSSDVAVAPRLTMLATIASQSVFGRRDDTIRSRSWQGTQRASITSFPAPDGNGARTAGAAPAAGGEFGPKLAVRYCTTVSASRSDTCAPFMIM